MYGICSGTAISSEVASFYPKFKDGLKTLVPENCRSV